MKERSFIDTNILVYSDDADSPEKCAKAISLIDVALRSKYGVISTQVLQEYFVASTRKLGVDPTLAKTRVQIFSRLEVTHIVPEDVCSAIDIHRLHGLSFWDSLILHAARKSGCSVLLSEDMNHGQRIEGVRIVNPFL